MSRHTKPVKKTADSEMDAFERSGLEPSPAFDDWDAWDEIDRIAAEKTAARRIQPVPMIDPPPVRVPTTSADEQVAPPSKRNDPPTEKQVGFLRSLIRQLPNVENPDEWFAALQAAGEAKGTWTKTQVSKIIDITKETVDKRKADEAKATPAAGTRDPNRRANKYGGNCHLCGQRLEAEEGYLAGEPGNWKVEHITCPPKPEKKVDPLVESSGAQDLPDVPGGHYAIESTGDNDLVFYRVDRPTEGRWAGRTFIKMVVGGHPDQPVKREFVRGILERIAADPDAATRYGQEIGRCYRCNRTLTDETSRSLGIGPECRKMGA